MFFKLHSKSVHFYTTSPCSDSVINSTSGLGKQSERKMLAR